MTYLPDTNILINALNDKRGHKQLLADIVSEGHRLACCAATVGELFSGIQPADVSAVNDFLSALDWRSFTRAMALRAGQLRYTWARKGVSLSLSDVMIATTALEYDLTLITENVKHFPMADLNVYRTA